MGGGVFMCENKINGKDFLVGLCGQKEPRCAFKGTTAEEFFAWKTETTKKLISMLALNKLSSVYSDIAENACIIEENHDLISSGGKTYDRQLWHIDTLNDLKMPVYVLIPKNGTGKAALVLHCHGSDGKNGIVGIVQDELQKNLKKFNFEYALEFMEKGYTVFCPDLLGSGKRKPITYDKPAQNDCTILNFTLMALGLNLQGVITRELQICIDFMEQFKSVDIKELICAGFSGGGLNTLWLAALDERIKTAYVSGYFHSIRSTVLQSNFCGCNFIPNLWSEIDMDVLAMLTAPRKLFIETGDEDKLNGTDGLENVNILAERTKKIYNEIYKSNNFAFHVCKGAHRWYGEFMDML